MVQSTVSSIVRCAHCFNWSRSLLAVSKRGPQRGPDRTRFRFRASPRNRNTATALILRGFWAVVPQHDPPQHPQRIRWRNGTERGKGAAPGWRTSPTLLPRPVLACRPSPMLILRSDSQAKVSRNRPRPSPGGWGFSVISRGFRGHFGRISTAPGNGTIARLTCWKIGA